MFDSLTHNKSTSKKKSPANKASELDQWYTSPELAERVIEEFYSLKDNSGNLESSKCKYTIEPSAGTGILLDLIQGTKSGFDLEPKKLGIKKQNFLTSTPEILGITRENKNNICFVGNPPFSLGSEFFNHAAEMKPKLIAMILPLRFKNPRFQNNLNRNYFLIHSSDIDCCYIYKGKKKNLKTVFQVWKLDSSTLRSLSNSSSKRNSNRKTSKNNSVNNRNGNNSSGINKLSRRQRPLWKNKDFKCSTFEFVKTTDEKVSLLQKLGQVDEYVFIPSSIFGKLDNIATTNINVLRERILKIYEKKGNKKNILEITKDVAKTFHFLKANSDNGKSAKYNAKNIENIFNRVDQQIFQVFETCSGSRCGLSQRDIMNFYQSTFDPSVECIYKKVAPRPF